MTPPNEDWRRLPLKDLTTEIRRGISPEYVVRGGVRVLNQKCIRDFRVSFEAARRHDDEAKGIAGRLLEHGDVLVNSTGVGTLGRVAHVRHLDEPTIVDSHVTVIRARKSHADPGFLAMTLFARQDEIEALGKGSTGQTELSRIALGEMMIQAPAVPEQRRVSAVVGALDDKIESNRRVSSLLQATAEALLERALFKGRVTYPLGECVTFLNRERRPLSSAQRREIPGTVPYYGAAGVFDHVESALFDRVLLLVGEDGSVVNDDGTPVTQYIWGPAWVNNHAHVLVGKGLSTELAFLAARRASVAAWITGAVQPKLSMKNLRKVELEMPLVGAAREALELEIAPLFALHRGLTEESGTLTSIRDTLLPKLVSGQIRVGEAQEIVDAA